MRRFQADHLRQVGVALFQSCGAPPAEALEVADHLVEASLMGLESHGVTRYIMYADACQSGDIRPGAPVRVERETATLAFAAPTNADPVLLDMSTSMIPEGKIRALMHAGEEVPAGRILDGQGRPTTDPHAFYGPPRGAILPFGSELGYRGFGLGLLVEILGSVMAGEPLADELTYVNGLGLLVVDPAPLSGGDRVRSLMDQLVAYVTSASPAPGADGVMMPGEREFRTRERRRREGIPLPEETCRLIREAGDRTGVRLEL